MINEENKEDKRRLYPLTVRITKKHLDSLKEICKENHLSVADAVEKSIELLDKSLLKEKTI